MEALTVIHITMTTTKHVPACNQTQQVIESVERMIYKNADDVAVSVARSCERLEERIDGMESRLYSRIAELEDKVEEAKELIKESAPALRTAGSRA
jgi:uncharacterized protein Yka (UPF0111/DUF47 family)